MSAATRVEVTQSAVDLQISYSGTSWLIIENRPTQERHFDVVANRIWLKSNGSKLRAQLN